MSDAEISQLVRQQRRFFQSGATLDYVFRATALKRLHAAIQKKENDIAAALRADLGKSAGEAYMAETGLVLEELSFTLKWLRRWMRPRRAPAPLHVLPARGRIYAEPFGLTLIMAPWNYPFHLSLMPAICAIAAGNCVMLKPSSRAPATAKMLRSIVEETFDPGHLSVALGHAETGTQLLRERWDFILYTGSAAVGKAVMEAASRHLTPVCLELGGKSPAIVCADADLARAARAIAWGKCLNAGQTCVAPDYVLAHSAVKTKLEELLEREFARFPGQDALNNPDYCRIISPEALDRLVQLAGPDARASKDTMRMAPLVLRDIGPDHPAMREEIFGPLLPVLAFTELNEAITFVTGREKPLACYIFTKNRTEAGKLLQRIPFGGGCVNDTVLHLSSPRLPFGGVGASGMGRYHGEAGFRTFSNLKGVLHKGRPDTPFRRLPVSERALGWIRRFLR